MHSLAHWVRNIGWNANNDLLFKIKRRIRRINRTGGHQGVWCRPISSLKNLKFLLIAKVAKSVLSYYNCRRGTPSSLQKQKAAQRKISQQGSLYLLTSIHLHDLSFVVIKIRGRSPPAFRRIFLHDDISINTDDSMSCEALDNPPLSSSNNFKSDANFRISTLNVLSPVSITSCHRSVEMKLVVTRNFVSSSLFFCNPSLTT